MRHMRLYGLILALLSLTSCLWAQSPVLLQSGDTTHPLTFTLIRSSYPASTTAPGLPDHINGLTGALTGGTITAQISKNGGSYASTAGSFAELANGKYSYTPTSGEVGTGGTLDIYCQASLSNATTAPTTATATSGGTIAAGTYFCAYTWTTGTGETAVSSTATQVTTGSVSTLTITAPSLPANASGINVYVGSASNNMTRAGTSFTNSVTFLSLPTSQPAAPAVNTATTSDPKDFGTQVVAFNPYASTNLGLSALPTATAGANGGLPTVNGSNQVQIAQAFPSNFSSQSIDGSGRVLLQPTQTGVTIPTVTTTTNVTNGVTVTTNNDKGGYGVSSIVAGVAAADVLNATASSYNTASTIGNKINAAGTTSDPWATALPGSYSAGQAGNIIGNRLDAAVSTRLATSGYTTPPTTAQIAAAILANPSNLLATDSSGSPVLSTAVQNALRDIIWAKMIDGSLNAQDALVLDIASIAGVGANSFNAGTHVNTATHKRQDGTTTAYSTATQYGSSQTALPATGTTTTITTPLH